MFHKHFLERNAVDYRHETVKNSEIQAKTNQAKLLYFTAQKSNFGSSYFILSHLPYFEEKCCLPQHLFFQFSENDYSSWSNKLKVLQND